MAIGQNNMTLDIKKELSGTSWQTSSGEVMYFDQRRAVVGQPGKYNVARIEYIEDKINLYFATGSYGTYVTNILDDGKTLMYSGVRVSDEKRTSSKATFTLMSETVKPESTNIFNAVAHADIEYVNTYDGDINAVDDEGKTPLQKAVAAPFPDMVAALIEKGADLNINNYDGGTALGIAIRMEKPDMFAMLVDAGASTDDKFNDAIHWALYNGKNAIVREIIKHDVDYGGVNANDEGVLESAVGYLDLDVSMSRIENLEAVKLLVEGAGLDVNTKSEKTGRTALFTAVATGAGDTVRYLIDSGADVNVLSNHEENALLFGIRYNVGSYRNGVALIDHDDVVLAMKQLIDAGIDVEQKNDDGETVYDLLKENDATKLLEYLPPK